MSISFKKPSDFPDVIAREKRRAELLADLKAIESQLEVHRSVRRQNTVEVEAMRLVSGEAAVPDTGRVIDDLNNRRDVTNRAIQIASQEVDKARSNAGREICKEVKPSYRTIVLRCAAALKEMAAAFREEQSFREALIAADVAFTGQLRPMALPQIRNVDGLEAAVKVYLKELKEYDLA